MPDDFKRSIESFQKKVDKIAQNVKALDGRRAPFSELFAPDFMQKHSRCSSFEALIEAGGFHVESAEDFAAIPNDKWEVVVRENTNFPSWLEMQKTAGAEWAAAQLKKGL